MTEHNLPETAALAVLTKHNIAIEGAEETYVSQLGWALGSTIPYEAGLKDYAAQVALAERERRDMYEVIAEVFEERAVLAEEEDPGDTETSFRQNEAARYVRENEDDLIWDNHIGPMLDDIELATH